MGAKREDNAQQPLYNNVTSAKESVGLPIAEEAHLQNHFNEQMTLFYKCM